MEQNIGRTQQFTFYDNFCKTEVGILTMASRMANSWNILCNSFTFSEIQRKWKEELDQELKRERGTKLLALLIYIVNEPLVE